MDCVTVRGLSFSYPGQDGPVLRGVSFSLEKGAFAVLCGPSGCGKSTISALLMGRNKGYTGSMTVGGAYAALWSAQQVLEHYGEEAAK